VRLIVGDCREVLKTLPAESVHCCVTSPPYFGLRDYGVDGQMGLEPTPDEFVAALVGVFREVRRVLRDDGTVWLNLGDSYVGAPCGIKEGGVSRSSGLHGAELSEQYRATLSAGHGQTINKTGFGLPAKNLIGIPWRVAFALQADGWYLRQDIIWHKPNPMPESVRDRCTKSHEYIFLLSKNEKYYFDSEAMQEPAVGGAPGNITHKHTAAYEAGDERHRTKAGLLAYSFKRKTATTPPPGQVAQHREDREDVAYSGTRNRRSVWTVTTKPFKGAHFATFPPDLIAPCVLAGSPVGGTVLDPFNGAGTTGLVAMRHGRKYVGIELNPEYAKMSRERWTKEMLGG